MFTLITFPFPDLNRKVLSLLTFESKTSPREQSSPTNQPVYLTSRESPVSTPSDLLELMFRSWMMLFVGVNLQLKYLEREICNEAIIIKENLDQFKK